MRPFAAGTAAACTTSTYVDGSEYVETLVGQVGDAVVREVEVAQLDEQTEVERHRADPVERHVEMLRYDTTRHEIRDAILTGAQKPTRVSLICRTEPTAQKWKTEKLKSTKTDMLRSISKQSGEST